MDKGNTIKEAIKKSNQYAKRGEKLAKESIRLVKKASLDIVEELNKTINNLTEKNVNDSNGVEGLIVQLDEIRKELLALPDKMIDDVKCISKKTINITLFGRTMAGKSTLMEILTHGNGNAIGKGYQRTTRDVREYSYKGLIITDVPGIAAFEGQEDEKLAYDSAKKADLIFFLITDDAPQASEAECLRKILNLGKPVVCLVNIKANIDEKTSMKMFSRDVTKKMTEERLDAIKQQFLSFGASYGQEWDMLTFEFVHLKAAYLSQSPDWNKDNEELLKLSRFEYVEKLIANEVTKNSGYYKIKAYIDTVVVPLMITADILIQQATENRNQSNIIKNKKDKLEDWLSKYKIRGCDQIEKSLSILKSEIKREIPTFAEQHYSDNKAGESWNKTIEKYKIEERCDEILIQLAKECEEKLIEVYREIAAELKFSSIVSSESEIRMNSIVDGKRIWEWGVTITTGVLTVLGLFGVPVVGWVALGVGVVGGLLSFLFKSKEQKIKEARKKLEKKLDESLDKQFKNIKEQLNKNFQEEIITKQLKPTFDLFDEISNTIYSVSNIQKMFADSLYDKQEEINRVILEEAVAYSNVKLKCDDVVRLSRLPGTCITLCLTNIPADEVKKDLELVTKEMVIVINYVEDVRELVSRQIGIDISNVKIEYDEQKNVVGISIKVDKQIDPIMVNRIKMAQQISRLYISRDSVK